MMTTGWNGMLKCLQVTSTLLKSSDQDFNIEYTLYESLDGYPSSNMRSTFWDIEAKGCEECQQHKSRRPLDEVVENQIPKQRLQIQMFIVLIDNLLATLVKRMEAYHQAKEILKRAPIIISAYLPRRFEGNPRRRTSAVCWST